MIEDAGHDWVFHHFGVAANSIEKTLSGLTPLGYQPSGESFIDEIQGIRGQFVASNSGPLLEIVENLPGRETVSPWLRRNAVIYHVAFEVSSFDRQLAVLLEAGAKVLGKGVRPAVAFGGRRICHLMQGNRMIVELVEKDQPKESGFHID